MISDAYISECAALISLNVEEANLLRVRENFERIASFAKELEDVVLDPHDEVAPIWRP